MQAPALRRIPGEAGSYSLVLGLAVGIGVILLGAMAGAGLPNGGRGQGTIMQGPQEDRRASLAL
jgi:hypothetical protein